MLHQKRHRFLRCLFSVEHNGSKKGCGSREELQLRCSAEGPFGVWQYPLCLCGAFFRCTIFPDCIIQNRIEGKVEELSSKNAQLAADAGIAAPSAPSVTVVPDFAILKNMLVR